MRRGERRRTAAQVASVFVHVFSGTIISSQASVKVTWRGPSRRMRRRPAAARKRNAAAKYWRLQPAQRTMSRLLHLFMRVCRSKILRYINGAMLVRSSNELARKTPISASSVMHGAPTGRGGRELGSPTVRRPLWPTNRPAHRRAPLSSSPFELQQSANPRCTRNLDAAARCGADVAVEVGTRRGAGTHPGHARCHLRATEGRRWWQRLEALCAKLVHELRVPCL